MIIAKGENHTQDTQTNRKGKLEWKRFIIQFKSQKT